MEELEPEFGIEALCCSKSPVSEHSPVSMFLNHPELQMQISNEVSSVLCEPHLVAPSSAFSLTYPGVYTDPS